MLTPVNNLTRDETHAEFSKLTDFIATINEELLSGKFGEATEDKFITKIQELSPLYARMSQLCHQLNLLWPTNLWRPPYFKH